MAHLSDLWVPDCSVDGSYIDYDRDACYETYRRWHFKEPGVTEDDVMRRIRQFVVIRVRGKYSVYDIESKEAMVQTAMDWAWRDYVRKRRFPVDKMPRPVSCFHAWLIWIVEKLLHHPAPA